MSAGTAGPAETVPSGAPGGESEDAEGPDRESVEVLEDFVRETDHWRGVVGASLLLGAAGVISFSPPLLLSAIVGVGYLAYARATEAPEPTVSLERELSEAEPEPGEEVTVTVTLHNEGEATLPDCRLVDGVPEALSVVEGCPRIATALRPGASATVQYTVLARRGEYSFERARLLLADYGAANERDVTLGTPRVELQCAPSLDTTAEVPLRGLTTRYTGRVDTSTGGEGIEFFATREYRIGDAMSRVDWNRYARSGELATLLFREERLATVVIVVDLRRSSYVQASADDLHAVDRASEAAGRLFTALLGSGDRVGIATLSPEDAWLPPGTGNEHRARARHLLATHPALSPYPPERYFSVRKRARTLRTRMPGDAQVVLLSPLVDDGIAQSAELFDAYGHLVTVISPDVTDTETPGQALASTERDNRMNRLRERGVRVVDWPRGEALAVSLERARTRWS